MKWFLTRATSVTNLLHGDFHTEVELENGSAFWCLFPIADHRYVSKVSDEGWIEFVEKHGTVHHLRPHWIRWVQPTGHTKSYIRIGKESTWGTAPKQRRLSPPPGE